jgi:DNA repair ATPase RecN
VLRLTTRSELADVTYVCESCGTTTKRMTQLCGNAENCERLESLVKLAKDYAAAATEMTALKKDYGDITKPLDQTNTIGTQINGLIERATSDARALASQRMTAAEAQLTKAGQISIAAGLFVVGCTRSSTTASA